MIRENPKKMIIMKKKGGVGDTKIFGNEGQLKKNNTSNRNETKNKKGKTNGKKRGQ